MGLRSRMTRHRETRTRIVEKTTVLPAPPAEAFAAVNSPEIAPLIDPAVRMWKPDSDPIGVGTRFTIRGQLGIIPIRGVSETDHMGSSPPRDIPQRRVRHGHFS